MKLKRLAYLAFTFSIPCFLQAQQAKMNIGIEAGQLNFDVSFKGQPVILSSPLGMNIDNHLLGKEVKNSTVSTTSGKYKTYTIEQKDGNTYYIDSWEFDDGVALLRWSPLYLRRTNRLHFPLRHTRMVCQRPLPVWMDTSLSGQEHRLHQRRTAGSSRHIPFTERNLCCHHGSQPFQFPRSCFIRQRKQPRTIWLCREQRTRGNRNHHRSSRLQVLA